MTSEICRGDCGVCGRLTNRAVQIEAKGLSTGHQMLRNLSLSRVAVTNINLSDYNCLTSIKVSKAFM